MGFSYGGPTGITLGGHDLREFSAKLLSEYKLGACGLTTQSFQGAGRSTMLLLSQQAEPLELRLPLEFWGESRQDTAEKWSRFCGALTGAVEVDLRDGFLYSCVVENFGEPRWVTDEWLTAEVTLKGMRQKPEVTVETETAVQCASTFPRTDCVVTLTAPAGVEATCLKVGALEWYLTKQLSEPGVWVLDGVKKQFLLNGEPVAGDMVWEDFPYLVPGENRTAVFYDTIGATAAVEVRYRPTFL